MKGGRGCAYEMIYFNNTCLVVFWYCRHLAQMVEEAFSDSANTSEPLNSMIPITACPPKGSVTDNEHFLVIHITQRYVLI